jgi:hypothetical protein
MARTAKQRRADEKRARAVRELNEVVSNDYGPVQAYCPHGHHLRSHSVLDDKGRIKAVVWSCTDKTCNAQLTIAPKRKSK